MLAMGMVLVGATTSCSDFFDVDSNYIIDASKEHLHTDADTIYSVTGILDKLQVIADRTVLLGEARGDLVSITGATSSDLRDVANFSIGDNNKYNRPSDYYAIINNCNYYIAKADTSIRNNRGEYLFKKEYVAVKAIRAWTYLQLVTTYGSVPFVTEPILSEEEAEKDYPRYDIKQVCDYFLKEDSLANLYYDAWTYPNYGDIKSIPSRLMFMPLTLVLGDLNLWAGNYAQAANWYHYYLTNRNGTNGVYPTGSLASKWTNNDWLNISSSWTSSFNDKSNGRNSEVISIIPTDSIPSEGCYSELRNIFHTSSDNNYKPSLVPSQSLKDLSAAQNYYYNNNGEVTIAPKSMEAMYRGDLRLGTSWYSDESAVVKSTGEKYTAQQIYKYPVEEAPRICTYRRTLVYLRLAEALNRLGLPRYAYHILSTGVNNEIIRDSIAPDYIDAYGEETAEILTQSFAFRGSSISSPSTDYVVITDPESTRLGQANTFGIHSHGCGFTAGRYGDGGYEMPYNRDIYPNGTTTPEERTDSILQQLAYQIDAVEKMIVDEEALEFAFEGFRFYDLMRIALRREDPSFLANKIYNRAGANGKSGVKADLTDTKNWFLKWNGKIGF